MAIEPWRTQICTHLLEYGKGFPDSDMTACKADFDRLMQAGDFPEELLPTLTECVVRLSNITPEDLLMCAEAVKKGTYQDLPTYPVAPYPQPGLVDLHKERQDRNGWGMWPWIALGAVTVGTIAVGTIAGAIYLLMPKKKRRRRRR